MDYIHKEKGIRRDTYPSIDKIKDLDENDVFHETLLSSQQALTESAYETQASQQMRQELESYLRNIETKLDSEGNQLIDFPNGYERVTNQSQDDSTLDAIQNDETTMNQSPTKSLRNNTYDNSKMKDIEGKLAEIQLLDKKLKEQEKLNSVSTSSPKSIRTVSSSQRDDTTFMTRRNIIYQRRSEGMHFQDDIDDINLETKGKLKSSFESHEELRIHSILHDDYEDYLDYQNPYTSIKNKVNEIDNSIRQFGRFDRIDETATQELETKLMQDNLITSRASKYHQKDYLLEQRKQKAWAEYENRVDSLMYSLKYQEMNFSGLLENHEEVDIEKSFNTKLLDVKKFSEITNETLNNICKRQHIHQLVKESYNEISDANIIQQNRERLQELFESIQSDTSRLQELKKDSLHEDLIDKDDEIYSRDGKDLDYDASILRKILRTKESSQLPPILSFEPEALHGKTDE